MRSQAGSPPWLGVSARSSLLPHSSEEVRSPVDCDCEAVGECEAHRDGGRRFAGLSGREKQGWRDGASAEQGSSLAAKRAKQRLVTCIRGRLDAQRIKKQKLQTKAKHLSYGGAKASSKRLAVCGLQEAARVSMSYGTVMLDGRLKLKEKTFISDNTFPNFSHFSFHAERFSGKHAAIALPQQAENAAPALSSVGLCGQSFHLAVSRNESDPQSRTVV
ncbi:hypothetical protein BTVI_125759 [Pitangus sulphuratus]|nr:hypothetical protein BTVI_125759 [Pitangus sulphuratus]